MSEEFDLMKVIEGMTKEQAVRFVQSALNEQTKQEFLKRENAEREETLHRQYQQEMNQLDASHLTPSAVARKAATIKAKYRAAGLNVW